MTPTFKPGDRVNLWRYDQEHSRDRPFGICAVLSVETKSKACESGVLVTVRSEETGARGDFDSGWLESV